jgi:hypothetical protein
MEHLRGRAAAIILRGNNGELSGNQNLIVPAINDCDRAAVAAGAAFHALDRAGQDAFAALRFEKIQQVITVLVRVSLDSSSEIDRNDSRPGTGGRLRSGFRLSLG